MLGRLRCHHEIAKTTLCSAYGDNQRHYAIDWMMASSSQQKGFGCGLHATALELELLRSGRIAFEFEVLLHILFSVVSVR